jgi:uridine kinase
MDLKVYIDVGEDLRLSRRIERDIAERGRTLQSVIDQYLKTVKSAHETYVEKTTIFADLIVKNNALKGYLIADLLISYVVKQRKFDPLQITSQSIVSQLKLVDKTIQT